MAIMIWQVLAGSVFADAGIARPDWVTERSEHTSRIGYDHVLHLQRIRRYLGGGLWTASAGDPRRHRQLHRLDAGDAVQQGGGGVGAAGYLA